MNETIHIYHTNDLHSHLEHWSRIRDFLQKRKAWHRGAGEDVYLFDIGDHVDRWHPFTEATLGQGNVRLLNEAGYDAVTIGNNEGITLDYDDLDTLYEDARFDVIVGNLLNKERKVPRWLKTHHMYETKSGVKVAVLGLTAYFSPFYRALGWNITDPLVELKKQVQQLKNEADVLVLLSHLGIRDDEFIAESFPEIDAVLGAHTHHILHEGKEINGVMLGAAGKYGNFVGHMRLEVNPATKKVVAKKAQLYAHDELPESKQEEQERLKWFKEGERLLSIEVANLPSPLEAEWFKPSPLPQLLCDALKEWCNADCSFLNAGLLVEGLKEGVVTKHDLHRILPHPINPCLIELSGAELKEIIKQTFNEEWPHLQLKGLGFRGKIMGEFVYSDIAFEGNKQRISIKGEPIDPKQTYKLAIPDMFTFGHFFPDLQRLEKKYFMPEFLRDVLASKLGE
ncbi:bifunctional metallophosphatase/5'-nucleotidase [Rossellomorea aquimaris]|uniref:bifunctional metallophosphatase/5'-nucleotidase n=1 Tax=Rossellomorea aquimaris TaxID=189382 RepID=UPI001CD48EFE|nr:bifunctional UDP-sugar hydrolase/5'-nucleotidase [Rossellomorea aquimaris]MCA1055530.1 bifunctional metallophosphatase/5'-nucleotidase [Rossellomorea aquimaris]